jgi:excisionase family DNA binding protein
MEEDFGDIHNAGSVSDSLTISEAASLLGVHKNTVRNRIKDGTYEAEKVITERGPTYLIKRESILNNLTTNTLSSGSQEIVSPQAMDFVQELLRPFVNEVGQVREELGAERARRQMAEERVAELEEELDELRASREEPEPEAEDAPESAEPRPGTPTPDDAGGGAQEATGAPGEEPRRGFWSRLFGS